MGYNHVLGDAVRSDTETDEDEDEGTDRDGPKEALEARRIGVLTCTPEVMRTRGEN